MQNSGNNCNGILIEAEKKCTWETKCCPRQEVSGFRMFSPFILAISGPDFTYMFWMTYCLSARAACIKKPLFLSKKLFFVTCSKCLNFWRVFCLDALPHHTPKRPKKPQISQQTPTDPYKTSKTQRPHAPNICSRFLPPPPILRIVDHSSTFCTTKPQQTPPPLFCYLIYSVVCG